MKKSILILCLSSLVVCFFLSSTYVFSASTTKKDTTLSAPKIKVDATEDSSVDTELSDEEQTDESLQVKAETDKATNPSTVKDAQNELIEDIHEEGAKNLR